MNIDLVLASTFNVVIFISALVLLGVNYNTSVFMGHEGIIYTICILLFFVPSIVFLRKGIEKVKVAESQQ